MLAGCALTVGCTTALEKPETGRERARAERAGRKVLIRSKAGRQLQALVEQDVSLLVAFAFS